MASRRNSNRDCPGDRKSKAYGQPGRERLFHHSRKFVQRPTAASVIWFFQAEDGIRDADVTGVQTCALPISDGRSVEPDRAGAADPVLAADVGAGEPDPT